MSYVIATPEIMTAAATDLAAIGSTLGEAHTAAAPALALIPAAADEVSIGVAHLFSQHAQGFQSLAGKAAAFHEGFVQNLKASASSYTWIEDDIARWLGVYEGVPKPYIYLKAAPHVFQDLLHHALAGPFGPLLSLLLLPFGAIAGIGAVVLVVLFFVVAALVEGILNSGLI